MEIRRIQFVYFTPIQLTRKIAYSVVAGFGGGLPSEQVNLTAVKERQRAHDFGENEVLVAALPSYGGRMPRVDPPLLRNLHGQGTPAVAVVTYGVRGYDDTLAEMQDVLQEQGFVTVAGAAFVTAHSMSPEKIAPGRPDAKDLAEAREFGAKVREKLEAMEAPEPLELPGDRPYKELPPKALFSPVTNERCVLCMQCYRWCPMDAITWNDPNETDASRCVLCQGCVVRCPVNARQVTDEAFLGRVKGMEESLGAAERKANEVFL